MFELFRSNIQELYNWSDSRFDQFVTLWEAELQENIGQYRLPFIYTKGYIHSLLSLFFVIKQQDLNLKRYVVEEKGFFLALVTFYIVEDLVLQQQSDNMLSTVAGFYKKLENLKLISSKDINSLTPELFFDKCFSTSQKIHNTFIKRLFIENYFLLMEVQGKDKIFPF